MNAASGAAPAPVKKSMLVRASQEQAFRVFTANMGKWWPKNHSLLKSPQVDVLIVPEVGGRWYEQGEDGSEYQWGRVLEWDSPNRVLLAWQLTGQWAYDPDFVTEIEVRFIPDGDQTRVEFEHRNMDRFGEQAAKQREEMDGGWGSILESYQQTA